MINVASRILQIGNPLKMLAPRIDPLIKMRACTYCVVGKGVAKVASKDIEVVELRCKKARNVLLDKERNVGRWDPTETIDKERGLYDRS